MLTEQGFKTSGRKGFYITFENGCTVSVQFGGGNYCANRDAPIGDGPVPLCRDAEIAGFDSSGNWITLPDWGDDVSGWNSPAQVLAYLNHVASLPDNREGGLRGASGSLPDTGSTPVPSATPSREA